MTDEFQSLRTLVRSLDVSALDPPDTESAIRAGRRRRRIVAVDRGLAIAAALALATGGFAWVVTNSREAVAPAIAPSTSSPALPRVSPSPSASVQRSAVIDARAGEVVPIGTTGKLLRLSTTGYCEESAPKADVPLGPCRTVHDPNGTGSSSGAWGHVEVVTGITMSNAIAVSVTRTDGRSYTGTLVRVKDAAWMAYFVVMPWTPGAVVDATHPSPPNDIARVAVTMDTGNISVFNSR